jgi:hypothetical protein
MITIVNRRDTDLGVYVGRPSVFGNPFEIGRDGTRSEVIEKYEDYFVNKLGISSATFYPAFMQLVEIARNGDLMLACWCYPQRCHAEVIKKYIELELNGNQMKNLFKRK